MKRDICQKKSSDYVVQYIFKLIARLNEAYVSKLSQAKPHFRCMKIVVYIK